MIDNRENNHWTVYIDIISKELSGYDWDKYYVGITSRTLRQRFGNKGCGYKGQVFYLAIQKYGWDNITHEILASNLTKEEACNFEKILISSLKCNKSIYGYNIASGGEFNGDWHHSDIIKKQFKIRSAEGNNPNAKTLYQFSIEGNFIHKYSCATEAAKTIGRKLSSKDNLTDAARNNKMCNGFLWAYDNNITIDNLGNVRLKEYKYNPIRKSRNGVKVYQFDKNQTFITQYNKIADASRATGIPCKSISAALANRNAFAGGYIWRYEKDILNQGSKIIIHYLPKQVDINMGNEVFLFSNDGLFIQKFKSQKEVSQFVHGNSSSVGKALKSGRLYKGFYYKYQNQVTERNCSFFIA